jgi:protein TonB
MAWKDEHKKEATIGTSVICAVLILLMIFTFGFKEEPEMDSFEGVEVAFGDPDYGGPEDIPEVSEQQEQQPPQEENAENLVSQDDDNAEEMTSSDEPPVENPKEETKDPKPKTDQDITDLANKFKNRDKNSASGDGDKTGAQGEDDGEGEANKGSNGTGDKGTGPDSDGVIKTHSLGGRKVVSPPKLMESYNSKGTIVVDILVSNTGKVLFANPGARGSKYTDTKLLVIAKKLALRTKFDADPNGPETVEGTITFELKLK